MVEEAKLEVEISRQSVPDVWPLPASIEGQYTCDVPWSLKAPELNFLSNFFELNYITFELDLPYFSHNTFDFNESGLDVGNPHFFPDLLFVDLEEQVKGSPEPNTYCDDSSDSGSQSGSSKYETDSGIPSDSESAMDQTPNPFYAPVFTPFLPTGSFTASDLDVTKLILLGFL